MAPPLPPHPPALRRAPAGRRPLIAVPTQPHETPTIAAAAAAPAEKTRLTIYTHLFREGVLVCEKDVKKLKHHELDLPNLHVVKAMLSLKSRSYVREVFNWCVLGGGVGGTFLRGG